MSASQPTPSFGRYRDPVMLGSGGMGAVYRATDPALHRHVAIKVLTNRDPRYLERFRREAQVLAKVVHPSIIQIYEIVGSDGDAADPYIVMEYFEGRALDALLKEGPLGAPQVVSLLRQCAEGLRKAHANHVVHRDIKPGNLMLSPRGEVKILDFGIAKLRDARTDLTGQAVLGTPYYMSPEQATGFAIDARSDIYSLGITAFHLLTGRKPFEAKSKVEVMLMQVKAPLPDIRAIVPCDARVVSVVERMCAKKPADRFQTCDELLSALDALPSALGGRTGDAAPREDKTRALPQPPEARKGPRRRRAGAEPGARSSSPWPGTLLGALLAVAVLGGGGFLYLRRATGLRGRVPEKGWLQRQGLRRIQGSGGYGNCVFAPGELPRGGEDPASLQSVFAARETIHGRCFFPRPVGENKTGQVWEELWIDGRKRAQVIFDPALPPEEDQLALKLSDRHAERLRELSAGKHTLDVWIYRQSGDADAPVPLAAGELVVRK